MFSDKKILLINAGSSSIKFQLVDYITLDVIAKGICEAINLDIGKFKIQFNGCENEKNIKFNTFKEAIEYILKYFKDNKLIVSNNEIVAIGHRVVHNGSKTNSTEIINDKIIKIIDEYSKFAPLHNPYQLEVIKMTLGIFNNIPQIACFDTGFHQTIDELHYKYAIKKEWYEKYNIRKFGFHGLSYDYINEKMKKILNKRNNNLIVCHLGSGCSICFIKDSKSFNTSMGFSTYDGLIMCTRTGDISPGILSFLAEELKLNHNQVSSLFLKECGLKGLTTYSDMRLIEKNLNDHDNKLAFDLFINQIVNYICIGVNQLEDNIDAIVFTGGIGENSSLVRESIINKIKIKKLELDNKKNVQKISDYELISSKSSQIPIFVVKTNEEYIMAKNTKEIINNLNN